MSGTRQAAPIFSGGERIDVDVATPFQLCDHCERGAGDYRSVAPTPIETDDARFDAWSSYLARWSLRYPCRLELRAERQWLDADETRFYLRIGFHYPDEHDSRDEVSPAPHGGSGLFPPSMLPDENTPRWLRANLLYHLAHELDEHLKLDGNRVFDPHVKALYFCEACTAAMAAEVAL